MELRIQTEACENLHLQEEQVQRDILLQNTKMLGKRESMSNVKDGMKITVSYDGLVTVE